MWEHSERLVVIALVYEISLNRCFRIRPQGFLKWEWEWDSDRSPPLIRRNLLIR